MRIVLTRPKGRNERLAGRLRSLGHEVTVVPLIAVEPLGDSPIDVSGYEWVIVTSSTGAHELTRRMRGRPRRVAAIGRATAEAFGGADLVPQISTQEGLLAQFPSSPGRVLFAGAENARSRRAAVFSGGFAAEYKLCPSGVKHGCFLARLWRSRHGAASGGILFECRG